jgi:hypothetical protein
MLTIYKSIICLMAQAGFRCFFLESGGHFNVNFNIQEYPWLMGSPPSTAFRAIEPVRLVGRRTISDAFVVE